MHAPNAHEGYDHGDLPSVQLCEHGLWRACGRFPNDRGYPTACESNSFLVEDGFKLERERGDRNRHDGSLREYMGREC